MMETGDWRLFRCARTVYGTSIGAVNERDRAMSVKKMRNFRRYRRIRRAQKEGRFRIEIEQKTIGATDRRARR
jgi:hypothetical protein